MDSLGHQMHIIIVVSFSLTLASNLEDEFDASTET